jgi:hypothetical protein
VKTVQDFNYKVALASGLKHLQANRLRQAEEQFRYLVSHFPKADGGYRGLARVHVELGDRAAALATLREGAAALSKAGDRTVAIGLLREAVQLDPMDLAAHRRLAAALALSGDSNAAAAEYMRYTQLEMTSGDPERAKLEAQYALETLGEIPALHELARSAGIGLRSVRAEAPAPPAPRAPGAPIDERTSVFGRVEQPAVDERAALFGAPAPAPAEEQPAAADGWSLPGEATAPAEAVLPVTSEAPPDPRASMFGAAAAPAAPAAPAPAPAVDPLALEAKAAVLIARKDPGAGQAAIEAASALLEAGKIHAASDLLLALVASGTAVHDAALELIAVASALGRKDIATDRATLLASAMRLAGEEERAVQVEQIAQTL